MENRSGNDPDTHTLHLYLRDSIFVEYFNSFLLLPAFSSKVFYNEDTGYFEQVLGDGSERDDGGGEGTESGGSSAILSSSSISTLYLSDDCIGAPLEKKQCWQWVLSHRLPLFIKSDLYSEFKLCKILTGSGQPVGGVVECVMSEGERLGRGRSQSVVECTQQSSHDGRSLLSTKRGMYRLWRFLQGTVGERSWLFWLDAERLKYCSSHQEQSILLRRLSEHYLSPGALLELPTDPKFRMGVADMRIGGVASVQTLQNMLADNLKHYWCHRFLLHYQYHKQIPHSHTRPHTSLGLLNTTHQTSNTCSTVNYPRVETPLKPSKTPTFFRLSKKQSLISTARIVSRAQSVCEYTSSECEFPATLAMKRLDILWGNMRLPGREGESSMIIHEGGRERVGREGGMGEREGGRRKRCRKGKDIGTFELLEKSSLIFRRYPHTTATDREESLTSLTGLPVKEEQSFHVPHSESSSKLPQSLRQSYTSTPLCGDEYCCSGDDCPPSRTADYHNLTKYTPHHLPKPNIHTTLSQQTMASLTSSPSCHMLSISGTPILPPFPPYHSPYSHMLQCLASEHRKAGGHFEEYLRALTDKVPLNCLHFWREVQDYKALFVAPSFYPGTVERKAKILYSCYVVESSSVSLSLPPSLSSHLSLLLHPPYDDLFDDVEEHTLSILLTHWQNMCKEDDSALQKVDRVSLSPSASRQDRAPSSTSYTALNKLTEEESFNNVTSPSEYPHTPRDTSQPPPLTASLPQISQPCSHPFSLITSTPHTLTASHPLPPSTAVSLDDIVNDPNELDNFKLFLNEHKAAEHLMCWMEIEAFRGIPSRDSHLRDLQARQIRERYLTRRYLFGPHSPASREAQRQIVAAGGGPSTKRLPARPKTPVFREAQKHIRAKLEKKWVAEFVLSPDYKARSGVVVERERGKEQAAGVTADRGSPLELKFAHSHEALMLRKALQCVTSRGLFLSFLSVRGTSDTHPIADVEFWLEVQRYKDMCHSHCDKQVIRDKLTAMKECYLNSSVPPKLHIDIPQHMADAILRKEVGPYVFREAQATVFRYLYGYWQDYQLMSHNLSPEKIAPAIDKMKKQMMELRKQVETREKEIREREQMMVRFQLETAAEREERKRQEREKEEAIDVTVNFTLVKPHSQYIYHTPLPYGRGSFKSCSDKGD